MQIQFAKLLPFALFEQRSSLMQREELRKIYPVTEVISFLFLKLQVGSILFLERLQIYMKMSRCFLGLLLD